MSAPRLEIGLRKLRDYGGGAVLSDAEANAVLDEYDRAVASFDDVVALLNFGNANGETEDIRAWCAMTLREIAAVRETPQP